MDPETTVPSKLEGVMLRRKVHKTGHKGEAVVFLSLVDMFLLDSYHAIAIRYCEHHKIESYLNEDLSSPFFINTEGGRVRQINFQHFCRITGYTHFTSHESRKLYATWCVSQNSLQLKEFAAFAASHSTAVQEAHYLGAKARRLQAIVADTHYQQRTAGEGGDHLLGHVNINPQYTDRLERDLEQMDIREWKNMVERRVSEDLEKTPTPTRVITDDTIAHLVSLIVAVGAEGSFKEASKIDVLDFFLGVNGTPHNIQGRALILSMLDFAPDLEQAKSLLEYLNIYCTMLDNDSDINQVERDWTWKLTDALFRFRRPDRVGDLSVRIKDVLLPLNNDHNFTYCFGNDTVRHLLKKLNEHKCHQLQSIRRLTRGAAGSVVSAIEAIQRQHQHHQHVRQQRLHEEAALRQRAAEKRTHQIEEEQLDSVSNNNQNDHENNQQMDFDPVFDSLPQVTEETEQTVAFLPAATTSKRRRIQIRDGDTNLDIPLSGNTLITTSLTPCKALAREAALQTPEKDPSMKRLQTLDDRDKIEILDLWIYFAQNPFEEMKNSSMLVDCENIHKHCKISRGPMKGVYKDHTNIADLITGRKIGTAKPKGLRCGPKANQGMHIYITEAMTANYPGVLAKNWTREQLRAIREKIIHQACKDAGLTPSLLDPSMNLPAQSNSSTSK